MRCILLVSAALVLACLVSCGSRADRPSLVAIDSLILQAPDSACELLADYPEDSLTTANDRAYHALLTTIADYKAYHPITTDSVINIAVNFYDQDGANQDKRMRSFLYKGCVMEELGNLKEAMRSYKVAQYVCIDEDVFHKGYIQYKIASLYRSCAEYQQAIDHYSNALNFFENTHANFYVKESIKNIGGIYRMVNRDSAYHYINLCIKMAKEEADSTNMYDGFTLLAGLYFSESNFYKTKEIASLVLSEGNKFISDNSIYYFACESYLKSNCVDSAEVILNKFPSITTRDDSVLYYQCKSDISKYYDDGKGAIASAKIADGITSEANLKSKNNGLIMIENECDNEHKQNSYIRIYRIVFWAVIFLIAVILFYYFRNKRLKKRAESLLEETSHLQKQISSSLLKVEQLKKELVETENKHLEELTNARTANSEILKNAISQLEISIDCYSSLLEKLLRTYKSSSGEKNQKIRNLLTEDFFEQLHRYIDLRFNGLTGKLDAIYNLTQEEINIVCLDICKFPTSIIWVYSNCDRIHSVYRKKKQIADKVNHSQTIADIPYNITTNKNIASF